MHSKIIFLVILNCVLALAKDMCECTQKELDQAVKEANDIVAFLNMLAAKDYPEDVRYPEIYPGSITGAFPCDCNENLRKKRRIFPEERIRVDHGLSGGMLRPGTRRCPMGYVRKAGVCIPMHALT